MFYALPFITSLALSLIITPIIRVAALRGNIIDYPIGERKVHKKSTPLLGGLALFLSFFLSIVIFSSFGYFADFKIASKNILAIFFAGTILMIGGFLDDRYNLKPSKQILFPLLASAIIIISGITINFVTHPAGGVLEIPRGFGIALTFFWLMGMMYTTKLLDGLDGLVSGVSVIGSFIIFFVSLAWDVTFSATSILALILCGSSLGFLFFNFHPAKIFLGEGGSLFVGFMLGVLSIISGSKIATALLIMGVPIIDVVWVIIQRIRQKKLPTKPGREHLHFRLLDRGLSHREAVIFLYVITGIFGSSSLFLQTKGKILALIILSLTACLFFFTLVSPPRRTNG